MRKVTEKEVRNFNKSGKMYLHGNLIAEQMPDGLYINSCGWMTNTTKERLNGIPGVSIQQKNFTWYLNGKEWDGKRTKV